MSEQLYKDLGFTDCAELAKQADQISELQAEVERLIKDNQDQRHSVMTAERQIAALKSCQVVLVDALHAAERVATYAHACWDSDQDAKVGKLLIAMLSDQLKYSDDTTMFRAGIRQARTTQPTAEKLCDHGDHVTCVSCAP